MADREMQCSYGPQAPVSPPESEGNRHMAMPSPSSSSREHPYATDDVQMGQDEAMGNTAHQTFGSTLAPLRRAQPGQEQPSTPAHTTTATTPSNSGTYQIPLSTPNLTLPGETLNLEHMELLIHMTSTKCIFNLGINIGNYYEQISLGLQYALKAPYLLHQFLAYSARHLAHLYPGRYLYYLNQADTHQTRAIQLFNTAITPSPSSPKSIITQANCVPIVLFSSVLGQTLIASTFDQRLHPSFTHPRGDLDAFLATYTQCMNTFRGVFALALSAWPLLLTTHLKDHLIFSSQFNNHPPVGSHCDLLVDLLNTTQKLGKLSTAEHATCLQMTRYLQVGFDAIFTPNHNKLLNPDPSHDIGSPSSSSLSPSSTQLDPQPTDPLSQSIPDEDMAQTNRALNQYQMLSAWTMLAPSEFSALVAQKRPEVLVILGYYALLLYYGRHMWQIGDAGRRILGMVDGYLGPAWRVWLRGPVEVVLLGS